MKKLLLSSVLLFVFSVSSQEISNDIELIAQKRESCIERMQPYPNPSTGTIHIDAPEGSVCHLTNLNGQIIGTFSVNENGFHQEELKSGAYVLLVQYGAETFQRKFVVL